MASVCLNMQAILIDKIDRRDQVPAGAASKTWIPVRDSDTAICIAERANAQAGESDLVLFIDLDLVFDGYQAGDQAGASLLEVIRFSISFPDGSVNRLVNAHCVIYSSFRTFESALRAKPDKTILLSPGTSFIGPIRPTVMNINFQELDQNRFDRSRWVQTVRKSTFIETDNHSVANWWGVHKLAQVHSAFTGENYVVDEIKGELQKLDNLRAIAFYSAQSPSVASSLEKNQSKGIRNLRNRVVGNELKVFHIDDEWENGWTRIFAHMFLGDNISDSPMNDSVKPFKSDGGGEIKALCAFPQFASSNPDEFHRAVHQSVVDCIDSWVPDVILLDLRLAGRLERDVDIEKMSGVQLLRTLRNQYRGIPVIMTTASNKAWSIEKLLQQGADAYWIKEGLDGRIKANDSVENYRRLLDLVDRASSKQYKFLVLFAEAFKEHVATEGPWYKLPHWSAADAYELSTDNIEAIHRILGETVSLLRNYLHAKIMRYSYLGAKDERHLITGVITYSFHILELIHNPENAFGFDLKQNMDSRHDTFGNRLRELRNDYAHLDMYFTPRKGLGTFEELRDFLIGLVAYLETSPRGCTETWDKTQLSAYRHYKDTFESFAASR